jgi:cytochrome c oxidase cbb3-type subunit 1
MSTNLFPMHYSEDAQIADGALPGSVDSRSIDDSLRIPVVALFGNAIHWLIAAAVISLVLVIKLIVPGFLGGISFLSYGRLAPIARDLFLYGWGVQAALAAGIWLTARLAGRPLAQTPLGGLLQGTLLISATVLWNLAILIGSLGILAGYSTGVEWLEYPGWASGALLAAFLMIGIWAVLLFDRRVNEGVEVAQYYLVAGFCTFPWIYGTANLLLVWKPIQASAQGSIQAWFSGSLPTISLLPISLAALYALLPRLLGGHLHRRTLAPLGFWALLLLGGWSGMTNLLGGPIPAWMSSAGVVAGVLFLIPVVITGINLYGIKREWDDDRIPDAEVKKSVAERFLFLGLFSFITYGAITMISSWPMISGAMSFTGITEAKTQVLLVGAISFPLFGVLYEALPHLFGRSFWCPKLAERHYWLTLVGFSMIVSMMLLGGLFTGLALSDPTITFLNITSYAFPFNVLECVGQVLLLIAAAMLVLNITAGLLHDVINPSDVNRAPKS